MSLCLNLVVLRTSDPDASVEFYKLLGLSFIKHSHGNGPEHYAAQIGQCVFEIYPCPKPDAAKNIGRLGFQVERLDELVNSLSLSGVDVVKQPNASPWGYQAVVKDPDGQKVELTEIRTEV